jgi:hypothetical protein
MNMVNQPSVAYIFDENVMNLVKFHRLADEWKRERGALSTAAAMAALPSYRKIMGMGKDALPFIFAELKAEGDSPSHWFLALAAITDENPVPPESRGKLSEMAKAWLAWGKKAGYVD